MLPSVAPPLHELREFAGGAAGAGSTSPITKEFISSEDLDDGLVVCRNELRN